MDLKYFLIKNQVYFKFAFLCLLRVISNISLLDRKKLQK